MAQFDGSAAVKLDFGGMTTTIPAMLGRRGRLQLATASATLSGPDKYQVLEHRRRQAQIRARHLLDLMEEAG
ncbi:hypothetical protein BH18ACI5_BH18ACI5_02100 [soil metagenome]